MVSSQISEQAIFAYIDAHREEMLAFWERLVRAESPAADKEAVNTVGRIIAEELEKAGASTHFEPVENRGDILFASYGEDNPGAPVILTGHMDTVFPRGTYAANPFRIDAEGKVYGPGALDMKAGIVMAVFVLKALAEAGYKSRPLHVIFLGDEEELHRESNAKSVLRRLAAGAGAAFNFETGFEDDGIVVGRKGSCCFSLDVTGVGAHAGNCPEKGRSAIEEMAHKVIALQALNDLPHGTSVNVGIITGGTVVNAVPESCHVEVDVRYARRERLDALLPQVNEIVRTVRVEGCSCRLTMKPISEGMEQTEGNMKLFRHLQQTAADTGYGPLKPIASGGWSDSCVISSLGIPVVCAVGAKGAHNHTMREYALKDSLFSRAKLIAAAIIRLPDGEL